MIGTRANVLLKTTSRGRIPSSSRRRTDPIARLGVASSSRAVASTRPFDPNAFRTVAANRNLDRHSVINHGHCRSRPCSSTSSSDRNRHSESKNLMEGGGYTTNDNGPDETSTRIRENGDGIRARIQVKSVHAAKTIDCVKVLWRVFGDKSDYKPVRHRFGKASVTVQLEPSGGRVKKERGASEGYKTVRSFQERVNTGAGGVDDSTSRYVMILRYGGVVFFNVGPREAEKILEDIKKCSKDPIPSGFEQKEHVEVAIVPSLDTNLDDTTVNADCATVKQLDMNNVAVIATIMGQTVAIDSYKITVDELLAQFAAINATVKETGQFTDMERETLIKIVAMNNSLFIDLVSKLGVLDRSDTAWNFSQYGKIYEGMKEEFEIDGRFEHIEFKLNMIHQNTKFFLEVLQNQKSTKLEWIIIVLIGFECVLMCLDMSGWGSVMFEYVPSLPVTPP